MECMGSLSSSSTLDDVIAQYVDNAAYDADESTSKCNLFIEACRVLLLKVPKRTRRGGADGVETEIDPQVVRAEMDQARSWLAPRTTQTVSRRQAKVRTVDHGGWRG